ncbi:FadR family transcriptional regulator [Rhodococcus sp. D2-41]|uniref:FCD domain-containing protein n=1 Tax=Speluncibacter jeojiensis TaxID=2710754 RepID=A0A9X4LVJ1_9ACTN|nr:FCD domain-containing protein [Rhodococcus sp. D2-41]MDG3008744.1 FadR family transcriptional regulator [Rhodococcus sp. D2-41]MDG3013048.1 FCD domain-containing protein [Corynebacteriales bacterium D3-21]
MQTVRRAGLVEQITEQLREEICAGRWPVGSRIPTEVELCELTGAGRNTVREAVQSLAHAGLVERRQGSGTYVLATSEVVGALGRRVSAARLREVLELRHALDVTAAALAATRRDEDDVRALTALLEERLALWPGGDAAAAVTADVALHRAVVAATHNQLYLEVYDALVPDIEVSVDTNSALTGRHFNDEHTELVRAVIDGDPERAASAARGLLAGLLDAHGSPLGD